MKTETAIKKHQELIMNSTRKLHKMCMNPKSKYYIKAKLCDAIRHLDDAVDDLERLFDVH